MSANLGNSAALAASQQFRSLVQAATREHAIEVMRSGTVDPLASAIVHDAAAYTEKFAGAVANDDRVSADGDPAGVDHDLIRSIVADVWQVIAVATPGLG